MYLSFYLSIYPSVYLSIGLSIYLFIYLSIYMYFVCWFVSPSVFSFVHLSIHPLCLHYQCFKMINSLYYRALTFLFVFIDPCITPSGIDLPVRQRSPSRFPSTIVVPCCGNGYVGKQPLARKEYCAEYWYNEFRGPIHQPFSRTFFVFFLQICKFEFNTISDWPNHTV